MSKAGEIPYTWQQIEDQIMEAILCQASVLERFGPSDSNLVADYLGLDRGALGGRPVEKLVAKDTRHVDLTRHAIHYHAQVAYDFAYQLGQHDNDTVMSTWYDVDGLLLGFPETDANGRPSPFCRLNDFPLRRMLETFYARFGLFGNFEEDYRPSIRELSLLANMTVPAVRTSLSKEGFRLEKSHGLTRGNQEDSGFRLDNADAKLWLSRRRGYIPQLTDSTDARAELIVAQALEDRSLPFPAIVQRLMTLRQLDATAVTSTPEIGMTCHGIFSPSAIRVRPMERTDDEEGTTDGRADHWHLAGA